MDTILTNLVCFILGIVCCAVWIKINKPATDAKPTVKKPSAQRSEPLIKRPTENKATWPHREIEDVPEFRTLPTDAELEAAQASVATKSLATRSKRAPRKPKRQDRKRAPQRRATWADVFGGEQIPQEWQPVTYTPVSEHRAKFKEQLNEKQEGETG